RPASTLTEAPNCLNASASSVAVFVVVPWSSRVAVNSASPDLPGGSSPVPSGTASKTSTKGKVFQVEIQISMPPERLRRRNRGGWKDEGLPGPGSLDQSGPCSGGRVGA